LPDVESPVDSVSRSFPLLSLPFLSDAFDDVDVDGDVLAFEERSFEET
jgi:hypothetical protein